MDDATPDTAREPQTLEEVVERRMTELKDWLRQEGEAAVREQRHLDSGAPERLYWHYGYYMALRDILGLLPQGRKRH